LVTKARAARAARLAPVGGGLVAAKTAMAWERKKTTMEGALDGIELTPGVG